MKVRFWLTHFVIVTLMLALVATGLHAEDQLGEALDFSKWEEVRNKNGIKIYTRDWEGSDFVAVKTDMTVKTTPSQFVANAYLVKEYTQWVNDCQEAKLLEKKNSDMIIYMSINSPWPVTDRDMVTKIELSQDPATRIITMAQNNEKNVYPLQDAHIRIPKTVGKTTVIPLEDGQIRIIFEIHNEPGGRLPSWAVNWMVDHLFYVSSVGLRERLEKRNFGPVNGIQD